MAEIKKVPVGSNNWLQNAQRESMGSSGGGAVLKGGGLMTAGGIMQNVGNMIGEVKNIVDQYEGKKAYDSMASSNEVMFNVDKETGSVSMNEKWLEGMNNVIKYSPPEEGAKLLQFIGKAQQSVVEQNAKLSLNKQERADKVEDRDFAQQGKERLKSLEGEYGLEKEKIKGEETRKTLSLKQKVSPTKQEPLSPAKRTFDIESTRDFQKLWRKLPQLDMRLSNLNSAIGIADKVLTNPIAGKALPYYMQKLSNQDAQRLELFLSKENVELIMQFAKEAGVRSIDTDKEREGLLASIANKNMSREVLKETLERMKKVILETKRVTEEENAYRESNPDFSARGFKPSPSPYFPDEGGINQTNGTGVPKQSDPFGSFLKKYGGK